MKKRTKIILAVCLSILLIISIIAAFCQINYLYHKNWIIGKTSAQIQERYGKFDQVGMSPASDGLHKNCSCAYFISKMHYADYLDMFCISFDSNGIAYECSIEKGPWGG